MKKHLLLTLAASVALAGVVRAEEAKPAVAAAKPAAAVEAKPAAEAKAVAAVEKNDAPGSVKQGNRLLDEGKFEEAVAYFNGIGEQSSAKREPYR